MDDLMTLLTVLFGGACTLLGGVGIYYIENKKQRKHAAAILYYDLKSIECYLKVESDFVNIRFFKEWQATAAECLFLNAEHVKLLYKIYDLVYDYNYYYGVKEKYGPVKKEDIVQFRNLKEIMFYSSEKEQDPDLETYSAEYGKLMGKLEAAKR